MYSRFHVFGQSCLMYGDLSQVLILREAKIDERCRMCKVNIWKFDEVHHKVISIVCVLQYAYTFTFRIYGEDCIHISWDPQLSPHDVMTEQSTPVQLSGHRQYSLSPSNIKHIRVHRRYTPIHTQWNRCWHYVEPGCPTFFQQWAPAALLMTVNWASAPLSIVHICSLPQSNFRAELVLWFLKQKYLFLIQESIPAASPPQGKNMHFNRIMLNR